MNALSILWMVLRRMTTQWRLELCLFLGLLAATGVVAAIPLYTVGALQDSFQAGWIRSTTYGHPGSYSVTLEFSSSEANVEAHEIPDVLWEFEEMIPHRPKTPRLAGGWIAELRQNLIITENTDGGDILRAKVLTMTGLDKLITMSEGRLFNPSPSSDGTVDIICSTSAADILGLTIGKIYAMNASSLKTPGAHPNVPLQFRLVGIFELKKERLNSSEWFADPDMVRSIFIHPDAFLDFIVRKKQASITELEYFSIIDHRRVRVQDLSHHITAFDALEKDQAKVHPAIALGSSPKDVFMQFHGRYLAMQRMMLSLALPTLILILYYVFLAAGLIVDQRRGEIAMMRSRGASAFQITASFALEWAILGVLCIILGPPLGSFFARVVGASAGFLNFVDRKALPIVITSEAYYYAALLAGLMIFAATIPAAKATRHSIVSYKQDKSRVQTKPLWQRFYLDFLLIGVSLYGYRALALHQTMAAAAGQLIDPFLFIVPTLLVIAIGLFLLRLMPIITGISEKILSHGRGVSLYASLVEVSRNAGRYRPLILLVVLTSATGIYGAAIARTLDQNTQDHAYYSIGADAVIREKWFRMRPASSAIGAPPEMAVDTSRPYEPPFWVHQSMPGVASVARVQVSPSVSAYVNNRYVTNVSVMAIDPPSFGQTAWFRKDLTAKHPNVYLNMLTNYPYGAIVSKSLLSRGMELGETITLQLHRQKIDFIVIGAVEYWPTLYGDQQNFIITQLDYVTSQSSIVPYDIWVKLNPGAKLTPGLLHLQENKIELLSVSDTRSQLALSRRDPEKMGIYGIISIGFCVAVMIMVVGFLLYTFITIRNRFLQFGVLRAIGMSLQQLIGTLCLELLWSVGVGLGVGTILGHTISKAFVPFMKSTASLAGDIPPFLVIISGKDIGTIYSILLPVLLAALFGLALTLARLQVHQAVKLGEEG